MPLLAVKKLCTYIEYYSAIKMNEKLIHTATWINLQGIMPNEKIIIPRGTQFMILLFYLYNISK